jgi:hypothetical protein
MNKKKKTLSGITTYAELLEFVHSSAVNAISDEDAVKFYENAPSEWQQTLLNTCPPSPRAEKTIVLYGDDNVFNLLSLLYGLYPKTIEWAMAQDSPEIAERVVKSLKEKPDTHIEELMVRRGEGELLKLWVRKFKCLDDEAERILNQEPSLNSLLHLYIEMQS